jgi:hypothetical protein
MNSKLVFAMPDETQSVACETLADILDVLAVRLVPERALKEPMRFDRVSRPRGSPEKRSSRARR